MAASSADDGREESVSADDLDLGGEGDEGGFVDGAGEQMLAEYQESKWGVVDDVQDESSIEGLREIACEKHIDRRITYEDEEMFRELSVPKAEQTDIASLFADIHADERNQFVPGEFEDGVIDFPYPESERVDTCTDCGGNGNLTCGNCSGSGRNRCGRCHGSGTTGDSVCGKCGGTGSRICSTCDGNGRVMCSQCEQRGQTFKIDFIRRSYTAHESVSVDAPDVPDSYVEESEGEYVTTDDIDLATDEIRHEVEHRDVPVAKLDYEYDGKDYTLYHVEDELKAESYPMSQARQLLPMIAISLVLIVAGLFYFGVI